MTGLNQHVGFYYDPGGGIELDGAGDRLFKERHFVPHAPAHPAVPSPVLLGGDTTHGAVPGRHLITVPALLPMAGTLREAVCGFLADHPRRTDARQIIDEFATTALIEQRCTCCPTGQISLTVDCDEQHIRLELTYHHNLSHAPAWEKHEIDDYCRGLGIINGFTDRWGHRALKGYPQFANDEHSWWAELDHATRRPGLFTYGGLKEYSAAEGGNALGH